MIGPSRVSRRKGLTGTPGYGATGLSAVSGGYQMAAITIYVRSRATNWGEGEER